MGQYQLRVGRKMSYTSADGVLHANSFWCLNHLDANIGEGRMSLVFIGYHDVACYDADRQPIAGAIKNYIISGTAFQEAINMPTQYPQGTPISGEILTMAWSVAMSMKEIGTAPGEGEPDTRTSFFEGAASA